MRCKTMQSIKGLHSKLTTFFLNLMTLTCIPSKIEGDSVILSSAFPSTKAQGKFC
jgi:hypothetical protein